jgi:hypothetical protein
MLLKHLKTLPKTLFERKKVSKGRASRFNIKKGVSRNFGRSKMPMPEFRYIGTRKGILKLNKKIV